MLCSRNFPETKLFMDKRAGRNQDFPSKVFCLKLPENFAGEPCCAVLQKILLPKVSWEKMRGASSFAVAIFLPHSSKNFLRAGIL